MNEVKSCFSQKKMSLGGSKPLVSFDTQNEEFSQKSTRFEEDPQVSKSTKSEYEEFDAVCGETLFREICEKAAERYCEIHGDEILRSILDDLVMQPKKKKSKMDVTK